MKTIAFHLQKGGVGKTTLSGTIAHELKTHGKTILIDGDPQANSSSWYLTTPPKNELADVLQGKVSLKEAIVNSSGLDILPSFGLDGSLKLYGETKLAEEPFIFIDLMEELHKLDYRFAIVDLSPGIGRLERAALVGCDEVITPMTPEFFSLDGIEIFCTELDRLKKAMRKAPNHSKIVVNAYDARIAQHVEIATKAKNLKYQIFTVPVDPVFRKSQAAHISPQDFGGMKPETKEAIKQIGETLWR
jgi:chromosome partitioning protein